MESEETIVDKRPGVLTLFSLCCLHHEMKKVLVNKLTTIIGRCNFDIDTMYHINRLNLTMCINNNYCNCSTVTNA